MKNEIFLRILWAFSGSLQASNYQPWVSAIPAAFLLIDYCSTRHSRSLVFLQLWIALT